MLNMNTDNEIVTHSETNEVSHRLSHRETVLELLQDAGGDSLTAEEIAEDSGLTSRQVRNLLRALCAVDPSARCVFEDETQEGFFYTSPIVDRIVIGF